MSLSAGLVVIADRTGICKAKMTEAGAAALNVAAPELLRIANETIPREESIMAGSGEVTPATADKLVAEVGYGGESSAYVVKQHEDTTLRHDAGQRAKWLEMAAKENAKRLGVTIGMNIKGKMG